MPLRGWTVGSDVRARIQNRSISEVLLRGWVLVVVGALLTCVTAAFTVRRPPVYWSDVQVLFIAPKSTTNPNGLAITPSSLIATAGVVVKMLDGAKDGPRLSSDGVTLADEGIRHGYSVTLPNSGGQWANNFTNAQLDVQVVGSSVGEVQNTLKTLTAEINRDLVHIQNAARTARNNFIRTQMSPPSPPLFRQSGSSLRALAATLALGTSLTTAAVLYAARLRRRRSDSRLFSGGPRSENAPVGVG